MRNGGTEDEHVYRRAVYDRLLVVTVSILCVSRSCLWYKGESMTKIKDYGILFILDIEWHPLIFLRRGK